MTSPTGLGDSLALVSGRTRFTTSGRGILEEFWVSKQVSGNRNNTYLSMANLVELKLLLPDFSGTVPNCARGPDGVEVVV